VSEAIVWGIGTEDPNQFPNESTTGTPEGWEPVTTTGSTVFLTEDDEVLEDVRVTDSAEVIVSGQNCIIRRCELWGGRINNNPAGCGNGLLVEDTSLLPEDPPDGPANDGEGVVSYGGYTARRVKILNRSEGFRVSSVDLGCGPCTIEDSFVLLAPPVPCVDWHGDGIQGFNGAGLTVNNLTIDMRDTDGGTCFGTAPFWWPSGQGNEGDVNIYRLLVMGMGYPFRLHMPASVDQLKIVNNTWEFNPVEVTCAGITFWNAEIVEIDANYRITSVVESQPCEAG
jgi:hypothetical protein